MQLSALLAWHWAWSAVAYHMAFFTRINPAAWPFAALFLVFAYAMFDVTAMMMPSSRLVISDITMPPASAPLTLPESVASAKRTRSDGVEENAIPLAQQARSRMYISRRRLA